MKKIVTTLTLLWATLLATPHLVSANAAVEAASEAMDITLPNIRYFAPDFQFKNLAGKQVKLSDYEGQTIMLNFWATWCIPCRQEMPDLQQLWNKYRDQGFAVLAVSSDIDTQAVHDFAKKMNLSFPVLLDPEDTLRDPYEILAVPMTYLVGRDGKISGRVLGIRDWASPEAFELIEALLKQ